MLSPFGTLLFNIPLADDDIDKSLEVPTPSTNMTADSDTHEVDMCIEVKNALGAELGSSNTNTGQQTTVERVFSSKVLINGHERSKACALKEFAKYHQQTSSTDHLKQVQAVPRLVDNEKTLTSSMNPVSASQLDDTDQIIISDPILSLVHVNDEFWLCLREVNELWIDGQAVDFINSEMLAEETVTISYQMLGLQLATLADDPEGKNDWRTYTTKEHIFTVPGHLIQPIDPTMLTTHLHIPFYLLQSTFLVALMASLYQSLTVSDLRNVLKFTQTKEYPYCKASGICNISKYSGTEC